MANETQSRAEIIDQLCRSFPEAGNTTLAKRLHAEHPAIFTTLNSANLAVRRYHGNQGNKNRPIAKRPRPNGVSGITPIPDSIAIEWTPFEIDAGRTLVLSDLHVPFHSVKAIEAALAWGESFNPHAILINGDLFDFFQLSRYDKNPTVTKVSAELRAGGALLDHVRQRFPKAKLYFKLGNHDERWAAYIHKVAAALSDIPEVVEGWQVPGGIKRNRVTVIGEQRPIMLGKLPVFHGHELGKGISSPVNPARGAFLRAHHTILVGHSHQTSGHADTNVWHEETFCWSTGCLCDLTPEYARINRWNFGFAAVTVAKGGTFNVENLRISNTFEVRK